MCVFVYGYVHVCGWFLTWFTVRPKTACEENSAREQRECDRLHAIPDLVVDACFITHCKPDGSFHAVQCLTGAFHRCVCVDEDGEEISPYYSGNERRDCETLRRKL